MEMTPSGRETLSNVALVRPLLSATKRRNAVGWRFIVLIVVLYMVNNIIRSVIIENKNVCGGAQ